MARAHGRVLARAGAGAVRRVPRPAGRPIRRPAVDRQVRFNHRGRQHPRQLLRVSPAPPHPAPLQLAAPLKKRERCKYAESIYLETPLPFRPFRFSLRKGRAALPKPMSLTVSECQRPIRGDTSQLGAHLA